MLTYAAEGQVQCHAAGSVHQIGGLEAVPRRAVRALFVGEVEPSVPGGQQHLARPGVGVSDAVRDGHGVARLQHLARREHDLAGLGDDAHLAGVGGAGRVVVDGVPRVVGGRPALRGHSDQGRWDARLDRVSLEEEAIGRGRNDVLGGLQATVDEPEAVGPPGRATGDTHPVPRRLQDRGERDLVERCRDLLTFDETVLRRRADQDLDRVGPGAGGERGQLSDRAAGVAERERCIRGGRASHPDAHHGRRAVAVAQLDRPHEGQGVLAVLGISWVVRCAELGSRLVGHGQRDRGEHRAGRSGADHGHHPSGHPSRRDEALGANVDIRSGDDRFSHRDTFLRR